MAVDLDHKKGSSQCLRTTQFPGRLPGEGGAPGALPSLKAPDNPLSPSHRTIDGVTYPGIVREKAAAQEQYSAAKARGESASLVK